MPANRSVTLTLGNQLDVLDDLVASGEYDSASAVVSAALHALQREREMLDDIIRRKVQEALDDPRPSIPAEKVFADLRAFHAQRVKADGRDT